MNAIDTLKQIAAALSGHKPLEVEAPAEVPVETPAETGEPVETTEEKFADPMPPAAPAEETPAGPSEEERLAALEQAVAGLQQQLAQIMGTQAGYAQGQQAMSAAFTMHNTAMMQLVNLVQEYFEAPAGDPADAPKDGVVSTKPDKMQRMSKFLDAIKELKK
jgi:hypothetical protein